MPDEGSTGWDDAIKGRIEVPNAELEDLVLVRSDGRPTYNFASPLEDWLDGITHVIRGDDHVSNTPKQINVLRALGAEPPVYAHVPNVFGADGKKLSKRHGAVSVDEFRSPGYLPEALMNFLALLGWAPDGETTIMSRDELIERFSLERVGSSPATFDYAKLDWMNGVYLRALPPDEYARPARRVSARAGPRLAGGARPRIGADRPGEDRAARRVPRVRRLPVPRRRAGPGAPRRAHPRSRPTRRSRRSSRGRRPTIEVALKQLCDELGEKPRTVYLPIRVAVTGSRVSPGLYESLELLGKETSLARLRAGAERRVSALGDLVGSELGPTSWIEVTQERIDAFAAATDDPQWIHVDAERAADGAVRDDDRPRLPHALALRPDALRGAARARRHDGGQLRDEPRALPRAGAPPERACAEGSASSRSNRQTVESARRSRRPSSATASEKPVCVAELVVLTVS